jgi:hypothetical protein
MSQAEVLDALASTRAEEAFTQQAGAHAQCAHPQRVPDTGEFKDTKEAGSDTDSWVVSARSVN